MKTGKGWDKILRKKRSFSPAFYVFCVIENTLFRFWWVIAALNVKFSEKGSLFFFDYLELMTFFGVAVEGIRRTFWAIIRVENEFYNNYENYRDVIAIPPIKEDESSK